MSLPETLYEAVLAAASPALRAGALLSEKGRRGVRGRDASLRWFQEWAQRERDPARPLVWVHAPSVGEGLMAQAIIASLRDRRPDVQVAFTHFSPSAERIAADVGADVHGYIPWDTRGPVRKALRALRPTVIAYVRTEVWPVLTREAAQAGARQLLVNAVLSEDSGRLSRLGRSFLEGVYRRLDAVGAVSEAHAQRYERLGVPAGRIRVTGDARFDQVRARIRARGLDTLSRARRGEESEGLSGSSSVEAAPGAAGVAIPDVLRPLWPGPGDQGGFTIVAGSTWPADEEVLVPAFQRSVRAASGATDGSIGSAPRLIIAPHEPTDDALAALERRLDRASLDHERLGRWLDRRSAPPGSPPPAGAEPRPTVLIVDRLGVLADLYALADAAYVGGGFGTAGLHSVVEPAALAVPVVFGPAHGNAREAGALAEAGGGWVVDGADELGRRLQRLSTDRARARAAGGRARRYVESETGAADRNADLILERV